VEENANVDRRYSYSSNKNFFSKFSMKSENINKENKKNIMISIKAAPDREYFYTHPHSVIINY